MANDDKKTPSDVTKMIKDGGVKLIDFKFTDLPGSWQHFTTTLTEYNDEIFTEGPRALMARASAAGARSTRATCS
jgi:glutamine synthetase